ALELATSAAFRMPSGSPATRAPRRGSTPRPARTRYGALRPDVNRYLKGAFMEAANVINLHRRHYPRRHVTRLYVRLARRKGHPRASGAGGGDGAGATYWMVTRQGGYHEPIASRPSRLGRSRGASAVSP